MADAPQNPLPPVPPPSEQMRKSTGKVQPKKETVRINLPPKPTAAPTIKLPTLPPGGPTGAATGAPPRPAPPSAAAPVAPAPQRGAAPVAPVAQRAAAPVAPVRQAPSVVAVATVSTVDKILAIAAGVMAIAAVGTTVWMMLMLNAAVTPQ